MLIIPQLVRILLEEFAFRGAVLLLSGLSLHAAVGSTLLQPIKWHLKEEIIDVEMTQIPEMVPIKESLKEDDEDDLPEMKNLIFSNNKKMRKNFSDVAISSMNGGGMPKRPTFHRVFTNVSNTGSGGIGMLSNTDISLRKRKASVISHLSNLDFTGSNLQVHMNVSKTDMRIYRRNF